MSDERLSLAGYVEALIGGLDTAEPLSGERLRLIVGERSACIRVDEEVVHVRFEGHVFRATPDGRPADGEGATDRQTVVDLLAARTEVNDAVLSGRLQLIGSADNVRRMFEAIEILIDVSTRAPVLQQLSSRFRAESPQPARGGAERRKRGLPAAELSLLGGLGLLPPD